MRVRGAVLGKSQTISREVKQGKMWGCGVVQRHVFAWSVKALGSIPSIAIQERQMMLKEPWSTIHFWSF